MSFEITPKTRTIIIYLAHSGWWTDSQCGELGFLCILDNIIDILIDIMLLY